MKHIFSIFLVCLGLIISSCGDVFELDYLQDPNSPTVETADINALYNSVQIEFEEYLSAPQYFTMQLSRQRAMTNGSIYETAFTPSGFDNTWRQAYSDFLPDADAVIAAAQPNSLFLFSGSAKVMKAYVLMSLVDLFGDVPYSAALNGSAGTSGFSPTVDAGADVYAAAKALLAEAITELSSNTAPGPTGNFMLSGADAWIKAANSLRLRAALYERDATTFNTIIGEGNYITGGGDDWVFNYGSNRDSPDARHPLYEDAYETDDAMYLSNWMMWAMSEEKGITDPRIRGYFYRQVGIVPLDNSNRFDCIFSVLPDPEARPQWYADCAENMPYCVGSLDNGYYGRDHGNGNGIPPDGDIRTVVGVYPAGGKFDNNTFNGTQNSGVDGALGAGIFPIITSFMVDFWAAEMAAQAGDTEGAKTALLAGVQGSIDKVISFVEAKDPRSLSDQVGVDINNNPIFGSDFIPTADDIDTYLITVANLYDEASDKMEVIAKEALLAAFGNGLEGYNVIRRTARPTNLQPAIQNVAGTFVRSALYPAVHVNLNQSASQKTLYDQVFWDTNPADLGRCFN